MKKTPLLLTLILTTTAFASFSDVSNDHPYLEAINYAQENNIVNGYKDWTFQPENKITREEFTKIIIRSNFSDSEIYWGSCFPDVNWWDFEKYICTAKRNGIIGWFKDWSFRPMDNISFLEAAKIIIIGLGKQEEVWDNEWMMKYWLYLHDKNAIPTSVIDNEQQINRWEMVEIIWRLKSGIDIEEKNEVLKNTWYTVSDTYVYFENHIMEWADVYTFELLIGDKWYIMWENNTYYYGDKYSYSRDKNNVYYYWVKINWADSETFEVFEYYAKDKNNVYSAGKLLEWADVETFEKFWSSYAKDKNYIYITGKWFDWLKQVYIEWADMETLEIVWWNSWYLKDKNNCYYDYEVIEWSDPESFTVLYYNYTKDKNNVYYYWKLVEWADSSSFEYIKSSYWKDKDNAFYQGKKISWVDLLTFEISEKDYSYSRDKDNCYNDWFIFSLSYCDEFFE